MQDRVGELDAELEAVRREEVTAVRKEEWEMLQRENSQLKKQVRATACLHCMSPNLLGYSSYVRIVLNMKLSSSLSSNPS